MPTGIWWASTKAARAPEMCGPVPHHQELLHISNGFQMSSGNVRARATLPSTQSEPENYEH